MNIPNIITIMRILLVPVVGYLLLEREFRPAVWLFLFAGVSDALDGFIARRFGMTTRLGSVLDPLADKLLVVTTVIILTRMALFPFWLVTVIITRELIIMGGAGACYLRDGGLEMAPSIPSKVNTCVQVALLYLVLGEAAGYLAIAEWLPVLFGVALATTFLSGGHYVVAWWRKGSENTPTP